MKTANHTPDPGDSRATADQLLFLVLEQAASSPAPAAVLERREGLNKLLRLISESSPNSWEQTALQGILEVHLGTVADSHARIVQVLALQQQQNAETLQALKAIEGRLERLEANLNRAD